MSDGSHNGFSQNIRGAGVAAAAVAAVVGALISGAEQVARAQAGGQATQPEELVFVNGRIHTMDAKNTIATTVTIRNGRFTAVGGSAPRAATPPSSAIGRPNRS